MLKRFVITGITAIALLPVYTQAANPNDLQKLLDSQKTVTPIHLDLSNTDLRRYPFTPGKIDLSEADLSHSNLSGVDLSKINLEGANLSYADLSNATLNQSNLSHANLSHANLSGARIIGSDLSGANLTCANLNSADVSKSVFNRTVISGASFVNTGTGDVVGYETVVDNKVDC